MANIRFRKNSDYVSGQKIKFLGGTGQISAKNIISGGGGGDPGVAGLMNWLKADAGVILSGPDVMTWEDQSGNARHWTASGAGFYLTPNVQNGLPVIGTEYTSICFTTPNFINDGDPAEVFVVLRSLNDARLGWSHFGKSLTNFVPQGRYTFSGQIRETFGLNEVSHNVSVYAGDTAYAIYNVSADGSTHTIRADYPDFGGAPGLVTLSTTSMSATAWRPSEFVLFGHNLSRWWGTIGEMLIYDHVLTDPDRTTVYNYLQSRWAV